jgi:Rha family phage regulatory protein
MSDLIKHEYDGFEISQNKEDGYVNATELCKVAGRQFKDWYRLVNSKPYVEKISSVVNIPHHELVKITQGRVSQSTWVHKLVAIEIARWISLDFAVWANTHILELMETVQSLHSIGLVENSLTLKTDLVEVVQGEVVTSTLQLAEVFSKRHDNILREVNSKLRSPNLEIAEFYKHNCIESQYINSQGKAQPMYYLTRKGFSLLALGFTGEQAELFKIQYINAFEEMYSRLKGYAAATFLSQSKDKQLVYIIKNAVTGLVKVGITNNIERRLSQLECATGCELEVVYLHPIADNSKDIERKVHERFADYRQRGEWFNLDVNELINYLIVQPVLMNKDVEEVKVPDTFGEFIVKGLEFINKGGN